eukprot:TRINITY_DN890_c0_g1_i1.p1 TRINITY_DN890_c0_g1~~TRINITY_DN890_c0_g1_i1.p1  ORF type:complete len:400 (-),score=63.59 TRINITY_DN890_c0_g1_i1:41-1240(-)
MMTYRTSAKTEGKFSERLKQLDFFPKVSEVHERSSLGAFFTLLCISSLVWLCLSELSSFTSRTTEDILTVDVSRGQRIHINMNITFPRLICTEVAVDVVDSLSGNTLLEASHQIVKERLDSSGRPFVTGYQKKLGAGKIESHTEECVPCTGGVPDNMMTDAINKFDKRRHPSKYPQCCNNCVTLRQFLRARRLPQSLADESPQCKIEIPVSDGEGCRVSGFLEVPKMKGDFHIAAGSGAEQSHGGHSHHTHQIDFSRLQMFDITHTIHHLSFGEEVPGMYNPLDNFVYESSVLSQKVYLVQVVPTLYRREHEELTLHTNQYSFTHFTKIVNLNTQSFELPGVFFKYDVSPLMVQITEKNPYITELITNICAIVGGIYVAVGILARFTGTISKPIMKKSR